MKLKCLSSDETLVSLFESGMTMKDIGVHVGISRERVRQRIRRTGNVIPSPYRGGWKGKKVDILKCAAILRVAVSFSDAAYQVGCDRTTLVRMARELGMHLSLKRLYRIRKRHGFISQQKAEAIQEKRLKYLSDPNHGLGLTMQQILDTWPETGGTND